MKLLSVKEAAERCGISEWTVRRYFPIVRIGARTLIAESEIDRLIESHGQSLPQGKILVDSVLHPRSLHSRKQQERVPQGRSQTARDPRRRQGPWTELTEQWKAEIFGAAERSDD